MAKVEIKRGLRQRSCRDDRFTSVPPTQDQSGVPHSSSFGSVHAAGFNMAFCDGSVRTISYSISTTVHGYLANRQDLQPINGNQF
jgi:prepilin-type processing-associated H-X9-DG protein